MLLIGDIHGEFEAYYKVLRLNHYPDSIQIGDFGLGFDVDHEYDELRKNVPDISSHRFIRGNHDNPAKCREYPEYLGDYGFIKDKGIYYISGGFSYDLDFRVEGESWWPDEQIDKDKFDDILNDIFKCQPEIIISHECPSFAYRKFSYYPQRENHTADCMTKILFEYNPKKWVFGHHHVDRNFKLNGCDFTCLGIFSTMLI